MDIKQAIKFINLLPFLLLCRRRRGVSFQAVCSRLVSVENGEKLMGFSKYMQK